MPYSQPGELHPRAKLTAVDVEAIRLLRARGCPAEWLAERLCVSPWTIYAVATGLRWAHVPRAVELRANGGPQ